MKALFILVLLLLVPIVSAAGNETNSTAIEILLTGGSSQFIDCSTNCSNTYNLTCLQECPRCFVNRTGDNGMELGEKYEFKSGVCDISFEYLELNETEPIGVVEFPSVLSMRKDNTTFLVQYTVWDHLGAVYLNRSWDIQEMDALRMDVDTGFTCPADITTDLNFASCSKYLDRHLQTSDPLLLSMVTGQNAATESLIECQSKLNSETSLSKTWHGNYDMLMGDFQRCSSESNNKTAEINRLNSNMIKMNNTMVPGWWVWVSGALFLLLIFVMLVGLNYIPIGRR